MALETQTLDAPQNLESESVEASIEVPSLNDTEADFLGEIAVEAFYDRLAQHDDIPGPQQGITSSELDSIRQSIDSHNLRKGTKAGEMPLLTRRDRAILHAAGLADKRRHQPLS